MSFDSGLQLCVLHRASDVGKRFGNCVFCVVDIHERVLEKCGVFTVISCLGTSSNGNVSPSFLAAQSY